MQQKCLPLPVYLIEIRSLMDYRDESRRLTFEELKKTLLIITQKEASQDLRDGERPRNKPILAENSVITYS